MHLVAKMFKKERMDIIWRVHCAIYMDGQEVARFGLQFDHDPSEEDIKAAMNTRLDALVDKFRQQATREVAVIRNIH